MPYVDVGRRQSIQGCEPAFRFVLIFMVLSFRVLSVYVAPSLPPAHALRGRRSALVDPGISTGLQIRLDLHGFLLSSVIRVLIL